MLKAIAAAKKKNDKVDARKIADLLRCKSTAGVLHGAESRESHAAGVTLSQSGGAAGDADEEPHRGC